MNRHYLLTGLWIFLRAHTRTSGWPVLELIGFFRALMKGKELSRYLAHGAEDMFRSFVSGKLEYFHYDQVHDTVTVAEYSPTTVADQLLVRYLAIRAQESDGYLEIRVGASTRWQRVLPNIIKEHLRVAYGRSLQTLVRLHPADFVVCYGGTRARLSDGFRDWISASYAEEENLVFFFIDLLQKLGARKGTPRKLQTISKYLPFMSHEDRKLLRQRYHTDLAAFFLINPTNFAFSGSKQRSVLLRNCQPEYGVALFLKRQVQLQSRCSSIEKTSVSLEELASRVMYSSSPFALHFSTLNCAASEVRDVARRHPAIFRLTEQEDELWLREERPPLIENPWNAEAELLAVAYFIDVLIHVGATSPTWAICFDYIIRAVGAAPPSCKDYLKTVYPALELIGFFHLHPAILNLSSENCVFLKNTKELTSPQTLPLNTGRNLIRDSAQKQAANYVAKLLKYVPDLSDILLTACVKTVPQDIRNYCTAAGKHSSRIVIQNGRQALAAQYTQPFSPAGRCCCAKTSPSSVLKSQLM